ncbi:MAG: hypothetical protein KIS96_03590 [Bauldia sp.]|nr:hypothetical protein [Bauldia sp.]
MANIAFDSLGYAQHLRSAGVTNTHAEAHAEAARKYIMAETVTKADLSEALDKQTLRMTVRLGGMVVAGVTITLAALAVAASVIINSLG